MKRPKISDMRIPKKYRDGKLLTRVITALEEKHATALAIKDPAQRFLALARLEKKIVAQSNRLFADLSRAQNGQVKASFWGGASLGAAGLVVVSGVALAPIAIPTAVLGALLGAACTGTGWLAADIAADKTFRKKSTNPFSRLQQMGLLKEAIGKDLVPAAREAPLALMDNSRFTALCRADASVHKALTQAFAKAQVSKSEAPATPSPDLTAALSKPRLPQVKR